MRHGLLFPVWRCCWFLGGGGAAFFWDQTGASSRSDSRPSSSSSCGASCLRVVTSPLPSHLCCVPKAAFQHSTISIGISNNAHVRGHMHPANLLPIRCGKAGPVHRSPPPPQESSPGFWGQWNSRKMVKYLILQQPPTARQTPETWQAWMKLSVPPKAAHLSANSLVQ